MTRPSVKLEALNFAPAEFPWIQGRDGKDGRVAVRNGKAEARRTSVHVVEVECAVGDSSERCTSPTARRWWAVIERCPFLCQIGACIYSS